MLKDLLSQHHKLFQQLHAVTETIVSLLLILTNFRFQSLAYLSENFFLFNLLWFKPQKCRKI